MSVTPVCSSPRDLVAALERVDPARLAAARTELATGPRPSALGSGEADEVALFAGIKPLIRQVLPRSELAGARTRFERLGLALGEASHRIALPSTEGTVLFVSRDPRAVREALACEAEPDHDLELGRLLGYPRCCVEAYLQLPPPRRNLDACSQAFTATRGAFAPRLNILDLAIFHYVSWLPCAFDCALSKSFADAVAQHLALRHGQFLSPSAAPATRCPPGCRHERFVATIDEALGAHRLLVFEDVQLSLSGRFEQGELRIERCWPTARDRHPGAPLDEPAREASARLAARIAASSRLSLDGSTVIADGAPIFHAADARLFPFGARPLG